MKKTNCTHFNRSGKFIVSAVHTDKKDDHCDKVVRFLRGKLEEIKSAYQTGASKECGAGWIIEDIGNGEIKIP